VNRIASLIKKNGGRLVNLSSAGHRFSDVNIDDPNFEHTPYTEFGAYGRSKTANILFAVEFDRRHKSEGIRATAVHPGGIVTELGRHMTPELRDGMIKSIDDANKKAGAPAFQWKTIPQGAATTVWSGFVAPADSVGGLYCEDCHVAELQDNAELRGGVRAYALNAEHAKALWAKSEEMVGEKFS
jgi:NAD(P)-dependent dehydrogenase (short-subunit alcohol dehydrogenase family)